MPENKPVYENDFQIELINVLERIARSHEGMLSIAHEARIERLKLSKTLNDKLKEPFLGK